MNVVRTLELQREWLSRKEAADFLGVSKSTLDRWAFQGFGPEYKKFGGGRNCSARYSLKELRKWMESLPTVEPIAQKVEAAFQRKIEVA